MNQPHSVMTNGRASASGPQCEDRFPAPNWYPQQADWIRNPYGSDNAAYNYPLPLRMRGPLNRTALRQSLEEIVRRHAVLRSIFQIEGGHVIQIVLSSRPFLILETNLHSSGPEAAESKARQLALEDARRPFDLTCEPLFRASLLELATDDHVLLLTTHHMVCDDWSTGILLREFSLLYSSYLAGDASPLPPISFSYSDFARQLARQLQNGGMQSRVQFWKQRLEDAGDFHHLAPDRPRPSYRTYQGAHEMAVCSEELLKGIKALAQHEQASPFMILLAAFQCLLQRYSGEDDIGVASCVANRSTLDVEGLIGPFSNRVVLRTALSGNPTFRDVLRRCRNVALDAYSHQDMPFGELVEEVGVPSPDRNPLFQVLIILQNAPKERWEFPGLALNWFTHNTRTTRYDLNVWLQFKDGLEVDLQYNTDLFEQATMRRILNDYRKILEAMVENPDGRIDNISVSTRSKSESAPSADSPQIEIKIPSEEIETQLTRIWEELFGIQPIGPQQNFFELGGDSLLAVRLFGQIEKVFRVKLPLASLVQAQTIEQLGKTLRHQVTSANWS